MMVEYKSRSEKFAVCVMMAEKYPGKFAPNEHEFIAISQADPVRCTEKRLNAMYGRAEELWDHERGMLEV